MRKADQEKQAEIERRERVLLRREEEWEATRELYDIRNLTTGQVHYLVYRLNDAQLEAAFHLKVTGQFPSNLNGRTRQCFIDNFIAKRTELYDEKGFLDGFDYELTFLGETSMNKERERDLEHPFFSFVETFDGVRFEAYLRNGGTNGCGEFWASGETEKMIDMIHVFDVKGVGFEVDEERSLPEKNLWCFYNAAQLEKTMDEMKEAMTKVYKESPFAEATKGVCEG